MTAPELPDIAPVLEHLAAGNIAVLTTAEAAAVLHHIRRLTFDADAAREDATRVREFAARVHREAGSGVSLSAHIRGRAQGFTPAKRALVGEVAGWVDEWSARVEAAAGSVVSS